METLNLILQTLVYPSIAAFAAAALKFALEWSKTQAREALQAAVQRAAGKMSLEIDLEKGYEEVEKLAAQAEEIIAKNFAQTLKKLGEPAPGTVAGMVLGEFGKLLKK